VRSGEGSGQRWGRTGKRKLGGRPHSGIGGGGVSWL
jgi:hypothetical protein